MKNNLKKTALYDEHKKLNARIIEFAGFLMPVQYTGVIEEHLAVRNDAGIFDVSHMGEIWISGTKSMEWLNKIVSNDITRLQPFQAQYNAMLYPNGTVVDDLLVYKYNEQEYMLCVNAANIEKDFSWLEENKIGEVKIENKSSEYSQIAIQGQKAIEILRPLTKTALDEIKYYRFCLGEVVGRKAIISRTGYTGEDGFELYIANEDAVPVWESLLKEGEKHHLKPAGLGARDTLRLEAGMLLYGNDMDNTTTALEAGLNWIIKFEKGDFIGKEALLKQKEKGLKRKLVGFELMEPGIARHSYSVVNNEGKSIGYVSSGIFSPFLKKSIGMAYVPIELAELNTEILIDIRGKVKKAKIVPMPFYSRKRITK